MILRGKHINRRFSEFLFTAEGSGKVTGRFGGSNFKAQEASR